MKIIYQTDLFLLVREADYSLRLSSKHSYRISVYHNEVDKDRVLAFISYLIDTRNPNVEFNHWADHELG